MPPEFTSPAVCNFADGDTLGNEANDWHEDVHLTVGGTFGDFVTAPAAPIFWCWHAFFDEIYYDWQQCYIAGDLLEFYKEPAAEWIVSDISALSVGFELLTLSKAFDLSALSKGPKVTCEPLTVPVPMAVLLGNAMHVYGRGLGGQLLEFYKEPATEWAVNDLSALSRSLEIAGKIAGDPMAVLIGNVMHVYAIADRV